MSDQTEPIEPDSAPPAVAPTAPPAAPAASTPSPTTAPPASPRRTVTLPVLPFAIVGGVIVALLFFGGGVAIGYGFASHDGGRGNIQQYRGGHTGNGNGNGFGFGAPNGNGFAPGQNQGGPNQQNQPGRPGDRPTTAPNNG